jgi:deoxyribodipyrimidine photo-lyase
MVQVPLTRVTTLKDINPESISDSKYVVYWMISFKRVGYNFALQRAIEWANQLSQPLLILEPLILDYPMSSIRFHKFTLEGMKEVDEQVSGSKAFYYPFVEQSARESEGLLTEISKHASVVITDDYPTYFVPQMTAKASGEINTRYELVDSNGIVPIRLSEKEYVRAHDFRRYLHKNLEDFIIETPLEDPLDFLNKQFDASLIKDIQAEWIPFDFNNQNIDDFLENLDIDKTVEISSIQGGYSNALKQLNKFIEVGYQDYAKYRSDPSKEASSQLSPYFHSGQISTHEVFDKISELESWSPESINPKMVGRREGWWGSTENFESFMDELITWRELGYHTCVRRANYNQYSSLPEWAIKTLHEHSSDEREHIYSLDELTYSQTHDDIWNAAQNQLRTQGVIQNYLRMLWGKKILEWTPNPQIALSYMITLNDRYSLDGRDPNSYSGVFWILGRYDRAWGPERSIFGKIRYMTSDSTARKFNLKPYLEKWGNESLGVSTSISK